MRVAGKITLKDDTWTEFSIQQVAGVYAWSQWGGTGQPKRFVDILEHLEIAVQVSDAGEQQAAEETRERIAEAEAALSRFHDAAQGDSNDEEHDAALDLAALLDQFVTEAKEALE